MSRCHSRAPSFEQSSTTMISLLISGNVRATNPQNGAQCVTLVVDRNDHRQQHGEACLGHRPEVVDGADVCL